jgi:hypothetical protein
MRWLGFWRYGAEIREGKRVTLREIWRRLVATRYTGALEREVARLRLENRALLNSILGIAGVPPIVVPADDPATQAAVGASVATASAVGSGAPESERGTAKAATIASASAASAHQIGKRAAAERGTKGIVAPMRRRSWQQIYRILEIDAARKKEII